MKKFTLLFVASLSVIAAAQNGAMGAVSTALNTLIGKWSTVRLPMSDFEIKVPHGKQSNLFVMGVPMLVGKADSGLEYVVIGFRSMSASTQTSCSSGPKAKVLEEVAVGGRVTRRFEFTTSESGKALVSVRFDPTDKRQEIQSRLFIAGFDR